MTQVFDKDGKVRPATIIGDASPLVVTQIKSKSVDGYDAVQVGYGSKKAKNINKAQKGHSKDLGNFGTFKEFPGIEGKAFTIGEKIDLSSFKEGDIVEISSISKGKGFQGVVKRHGFGGGPRSHGQKHSEREPGSISGGTRNGGRVPKAMRMAGRMGSDRITVKNLTVLHVDTTANQIFLEGAIPGKRGTLVEIRG